MMLKLTERKMMLKLTLEKREELFTEAAGVTQNLRRS